MRSKEQILKDLKPKEINFEMDEFEEIKILDWAEMSENMKQRLHRDLTHTFNNWIQGKHRRKEQVKINIKGQPRSGKSLIGLTITRKNCTLQEKEFNVDKSVCANQKVLKQKLFGCEFGDSFLIDENAFANVGAGSMTEMLQLKDINNIIAKNNNSLVYITPMVFLNTGAPYGLEFYGKDIKNWLSRFLLYDTSQNTPILLGYVIFNIGKLFQDEGCLIYSQTGGCTNPNRLKLSQIKEDTIKESSCIPNDFDKSQIDENSQVCPFYNICTSQLCEYEHIKDDWIAKEMKGGLEIRDAERLEISVKLFIDLWDNESKKLKFKNLKEGKIKIKMKLPNYSNSKFTGVELEEITQTIISLQDRDFLKDVCKQTEIDFESIVSQIDT